MAGDREQIVFHTTDGTKVTDPAVEATVNDHAGQGAEASPTSPPSPAPTDPGGATQISADGTTGVRHRDLRRAGPVHLAPRWPRQFVNTAQTRRRARTCRWRWPARWPRRPTGVRSAAPGSGSSWPAIVLLLVFGSVFAMALPLLSALASLGTAIGLIGLLSHVLKMPAVLDRAGPADRARAWASTTPCSS